MWTRSTDDRVCNRHDHAGKFVTAESARSRASVGGDVFSPLYSSYSEVLFTLTGCGIENASLVAFGRKTRSKILGRINRKAIARGHPGCRMHGKGFVFVFRITSLSYFSLLFFVVLGELENDTSLNDRMW